MKMDDAAKAGFSFRKSSMVKVQEALEQLRSRKVDTDIDFVPSKRIGNPTSKAALGTGRKTY